jgi:hypothetical protein
MAREPQNRQDNLRERIAHLAARIMAEDGIDDFGYAKRKAARQAGAHDMRAMPDNEEIERALAIYRELYQQDEHAPLLAELRLSALDLMRSLSQFNPHLFGPVLSGVAGKHSGIDLHLFADSGKDFEIYLLNRGIRYKAAQLRVFINHAERVVPVYSFVHRDTDVRAIVLDNIDQRSPLKSSPGGRPVERGSIAYVESLVDSK